MSQDLQSVKKGTQNMWADMGAKGRISARGTKQPKGLN